MNFDKDKYIQLLLHILSQSYNRPQFGKTVLCSILYFIDFSYYERYGTLLTKETYVKSKKGIKPKHFNKITDELISKKQLFLRKETYYSRQIYKYYLMIIPNNKFTKKEQEIIDLTLSRLIDNNATTITRYMRYDPPVSVADLGENLDCRYVFCRNNDYSTLKPKLKNE